MDSPFLDQNSRVQMNAIWIRTEAAEQLDQNPQRLETALVISSVLVKEAGSKSKIKY